MDDKRQSGKKTTSGDAEMRSPSPSTISTASSGSPLVRNGEATSSGKSFTFSISSQTSGNYNKSLHSSTKRPAPTSIAAAQLNQLEEEQKSQKQSAGSGGAGGNCKSKWPLNGNGNKLAHIMMATKQHQQQQQQVIAKGEQDFRPPINSPKQAEKINVKKPDNSDESSRSFGYNVGKSIAYRANRFNEFWSTNKMRYLNLACLLMTLVCLLTILLFSKSSFVNNEHYSPTIVSGASQSKRTEWSSDGPKVESIDSLGKQALVNSLEVDKDKWKESDGAREENESEEEGDEESGRTTDGFNLFDEQQQPQAAASSLASSFKRDLSASSPNQQHQSHLGRIGERESDESTATTTQRPPSANANSLDPLLGSMFDDLDGFGLFKAIKSQLISNSNNNNNSGSFMKPIIRRDKNGATIIISGTINGNNNAKLNQTEISSATSGSLFDKLLPFGRPFGLGPVLSQQPLQATIKRTVHGPGSFGTTISIQSSSPVAEIGSPIAMMMMRNPLFSSTFGSGGGSGADEELHQPPFVRSFSSSPFFPPPQLLPPSLLSMILRAASSSPISVEHQAVSHNSTASANATEAPNQSSNPLQEPLSAQASQQQVKLSNGTNLAASGNQTAATNSTATKDSDASEVELFDVSHLPRALPFPANRAPLFGGASSQASPADNSMIVISSSSLADPSERRRFASPFGPAPFGDAIGGGRMFVLNRGRSSPFFLSQSGGEFPSPASPFLRSILGQVVSDMWPSGELSSERKLSLADRSDSVDPMGMGADNWDESRRHSKAHKMAKLAAGNRHRFEERDSSEELASPLGPFVEQLFSPTEQRGPFDFGPISFGGGALIRQALMRPGATIERVVSNDQAGPSSTMEAYESGAQGDRQQVGHGVRSQSISRADNLDGGDQQVDSDQQESASMLDRLLSGGDSMTLRLKADSAAPFFMRSPMHRGARQLALSAPSNAADSDSDQEEPSDESNDDEQLPSDESPQVWPSSFRLGRARLAPKHQDLSLMTTIGRSKFPPARFSVPASVESDKRPTSGSNYSESQQLEENLNRAISVAAEAAAAAAAGEQHQQHQQQQQPSRPPQPDALSPPPSGAVAQSDFTSPNSPLFGFPASQIHSPERAVQNNANKIESKPFVYHSNNEVAKPFATQSVVQASSQARSTDEEQQHQPAAIVMGRRLDDGPFSPDEQHQQQHNHHQMEHHHQSAFRSMGMNARKLEQPISLSGEVSDSASLQEANKQHPPKHQVDVAGSGQAHHQSISAKPFKTIEV